MKIAILGTRGIPNNYGGFEQCAEHLSVGLVENGYDVTVYSVNNHPYNEEKFKGVNITKKWCPEKKIGSAAHFIYDFICLRDALKQDFDVIFEFGYQSVAISFMLLSIKDSIIVTNMDGLEWKRAKWSPFVKKITKWFEKIAAEKSTFLISDNKGIQDYLKQKYNVASSLIPYGADEVESDNSFVKYYNAEECSYFLLVARLEPENNIEMILDGYVASKMDLPFLVVGNAETKYGSFLKDKYKDTGTVFLGSIFNKQHLDSLRRFSQCYFHGHSVGGTNPALLEAMAAKSFIFAHDNVFNRDVLGDNAFFFSSDIEIQEMLFNFNNLALKKAEMIDNNSKKIRNKYFHKNIIKQYIELINKVTL
jgi:glycosyltransferase involved in cell wall biosynthesis